MSKLRNVKKYEKGLHIVIILLDIELTKYLGKQDKTRIKRNKLIMEFKGFRELMSINNIKMCKNSLIKIISPIVKANTVPYQNS